MMIEDLDHGLRVATLNLRLHLDEWEARSVLVVEELARLQPHLLALQEVWLPIDQAHWLARQLNERLSRGASRYSVVQRPKWGFEPGLESVAVLSRLPLLRSDGVDLPGGRVASSARVRWRDREVEFVSVHLHFGPPDSSDGARRSQIRSMFAWLGQLREEDGPQGSPVTVVAGDFNATPDTEAAALMRADWRSAYAELHGREPEWTFGTPLADRNNLARGVGQFRGTLDYIFVPAGVVVEAAGLFCERPAEGRPELYASDHLGLHATLELPERPLEIGGRALEGLRVPSLGAPSAPP